ncbi:uncharacterized protein B0J16DRAFT_340807, partial [Fusarium flagelliforme]|uniref:uncharacterized protein n=1 Tax=Fusarium flagelliforme TaxID=2675880 RepID=UPI001E8DE5F9
MAEIQQRSDLFDYADLTYLISQTEEEGSHDFIDTVFADICEGFESELKKIEPSTVRESWQDLAKLIFCDHSEKGHLSSIDGPSHWIHGTFASVGAQRIRDIFYKIMNLSRCLDENRNFVKPSDALERIGEILQSGDKDIKDTLSYLQRLSKL